MNITETKKEAEKILTRMNDMVRGRDYVKLLMEGRLDQMCQEIGELGWLALIGSLKVKDVAGKRETHVRFKLVDPDSKEAQDLP